MQASTNGRPVRSFGPGGLTAPCVAAAQAGVEGWSSLNSRSALAFSFWDEVANASAIAPQSRAAPGAQVARVVGGRAFTSLRLPPALLQLPPHRQVPPVRWGDQREQWAKAVCGWRAHGW